MLIMTDDAAGVPLDYEELTGSGRLLDVIARRRRRPACSIYAGDKTMDGRRDCCGPRLIGSTSGLHRPDDLDHREDGRIAQ
jgi:hypothetical protein